VSITTVGLSRLSRILDRAAAPRCGFVRATSDRLRLRRNTRLEHESVVFDSRDIFSISNPPASRYRERRENARPAILALYFIANRECRPRAAVLFVYFAFGAVHIPHLHNAIRSRVFEMYVPTCTGSDCEAAGALRT